MELIELTKSRKLYALNYAIEAIKDEKARAGFSIGICFHLDGQIETIIGEPILYEEIKNFIPEFKKPSELTTFEDDYWWPREDFDSRITYLENLIKQIENDTTK